MEVEEEFTIKFDSIKGKKKQIKFKGKLTFEVLKKLANRCAGEEMFRQEDEENRYGF